MSMDGEGQGEVSRLVKELVLRILPANSSSGGDTGSKHVENAYKYAMRIIGSRIVPSLSNDEAAMAEAIKRQLVLENRSSDALTFADFYRRFSSLTGPASIENKWALLYLLRLMSEDHRRETSGTKGVAASLTSTLSGPAAMGGLPAILGKAAVAKPDVGLDISSFSGSRSLDTLATERTRPFNLDRVPPGGVLVLSRGAENLKANAVREFVELLQEESEVTEMALARDVIYACQGIDGCYVKFDNELEEYVVEEKFKVPRTVRVLVGRLCEGGCLFRRVREHISASLSQGSMEVIGTVGQAFCTALQEELSEYYRLMAVLESQAHNPIPLMLEGRSAGNYLSLRRLSVWLAEPLVRLRLMAVLAGDCQSLRGGAMAGAIHMHAQHGDPLVRSFMGRLLQRVCTPLFEMARRWVLEGELDDIYGEFFVVAQPVKADALWREGYQLQSGMLPSFIPETLAQRILRTGKSINFLRVCCNDQGWADAASEAVSAAAGRGSGETEALHALVVEAAKRIDKHLIEIIYGRYRFREHCLALKRYLLLGQGDFIQYLMDVVGPDLSQPANTISSFKLAGLLESAIRTSNAQYDDNDILERLRVKMMPHSDGDRGWDVFSLEYNARDPLSTIFTESIMAGYLKIFNFLWRLKRVDHALSATWQAMKPNCSLARLRNGSDGGGEKSQLAAILRRSQTLRNEMNHFVTNLQYYIMFEVLEYSWAKFLEEMEEACDLDELIAAHERYLGSILEKSLLGERSKLLCKTLLTLFDLILRFRGIGDRLFENALAVLSRGDSGVRMKSKRETQVGAPRSRAGKSSTAHITVEFLKSLGGEMDEIAQEYSSMLEGFIAQLPVQQHVDLKFLSFRLDFSEFYTRQHMSMSTAPLKLKRAPLRGVAKSSEHALFQ